MTTRRSLLAGRNVRRLSDDEIRRAANVFRGMEPTVNVRHVEDATTSFRVAIDDDQSEFGEVVFGPDIYPGTSIVDPNSALGLPAAAAHELMHFHRWKDKVELPIGKLTHIDEALTSLQAIMRYDRHLSEHDIRQLVLDAIQRLMLFVRDGEPEG